jgi:serine/threonine protein phosphatase PrpC
MSQLNLSENFETGYKPRLIYWDWDAMEQRESLSFSWGDIALISSKWMWYQRNEDRIFLQSKTRTFWVVDGIGGYNQSEEAAQILAEVVLEESEKGTLEDVASVHERAFRVMQARGFSSGWGACYACVSISESEAHIFWAGDVSSVLFREGFLMHRTTPTPIANAPSSFGIWIATESRVSIQENDIILMASDWFWDNIDMTELKSLIQEKQKEPVGALLKEVFLIAMEGMTHGFMTDYNGLAPTRRKDYWKKDNISLIIFRVKWLKMAPESTVKANVSELLNLVECSK